LARIEHISVSGQYIKINRRFLHITIGKALQIVVYTSFILSFPLCYANTIGPAIHTLPSEAQQIKKSAKTSNWRSEFALVHLKARQIYPASPIRAKRHTAPIILAGVATYMAQYVTRNALPILPEPAYNSGSTDRKWKRDLYPSNYTTFNPPSFSLDTTFKAALFFSNKGSYDFGLNCYARYRIIFVVSMSDIRHPKLVYVRFHIRVTVP
jgi:hypothetical protein